ncbi:hypothetical protein CGJ88_23450 [Vibrio parahaemolyticus]|nr:hypothetical protein CGJ88_23450 [Vibrio parahaemolyticus]
MKVACDGIGIALLTP